MTRPAPPLLHVIFDALKERGWAILDGYYEDPEGNPWEDLGDAIHAQCMREIAAAGPGEHGVAERRRGE